MNNLEGAEPTGIRIYFRQFGIQHQRTTQEFACYFPRRRKENEFHTKEVI